MNLGRNDPCRCGSGRKYKKCCAAKDEAATTAQLATEAAKTPSADAKDAAAASEPTRKEANARAGEWLVPSRKQSQDTKAMRARRRTV